MIQMGHDPLGVYDLLGVKWRCTQKKDPNGKPSGSISYEKTISRLQAMFFSYRLVEVSLTMILFVVLAQT